MSARISKRKEKIKMVNSLSNKDLISELGKVAPKFKAKIRQELAKRGIKVDGKTNEVVTA